MSELLKRLEQIRRDKNLQHEAIIQIKVDVKTRKELIANLERDGLSYKDLFGAAIDIYLTRNDK